MADMAVTEMPAVMPAVPVIAAAATALGVRDLGGKCDQANRDNQNDKLFHLKIPSCKGGQMRSLAARSPQSWQKFVFSRFSKCETRGATTLKFKRRRFLNASCVPN
jgi:hypothetical protein